MSIDSFKCDSSPVESNGDSPADLNVTALSLPTDFDDSLCLDLYKDLVEEAAQITGARPDANDADSTTPPGNDIISTKYEEMEARIRQLLAANLDLKERGRLYDNLKARHVHQEAEIEELTTKLRDQVSLNESCTAREQNLQHQVLELKRKINLAKIENDHSCKEIELLQNRAEKAESDYESNANALKTVQAKLNDSITRHAIEMEDLKKKTDLEITRIRNETSKEVVLQRKCREEAFARESKLLIDARDYAVEQSKALQQELHSLRSDKACKDAETSDITNQLERQLSDVRSDLKVKSLELTTLQASYDRIAKEAKQLNAENAKNKEEVHQYAIEQRRLEEIIRQKEDSLEIYQHDDLLVQDSSTSVTTRRQSLVKNSVVLAKKCRELQSLLDKSMKELSIEREKNDTLAKQADNDRRLYRELTTKSNKNTSEYILDAVKDREKDIARLNSKVRALQTELCNTRKERDRISAQLAKILEGRKNLNSMKVLVDEGMKQRKFVNAVTKTTGCPNKEDIDQDDLLEHIVYHKNRK